MKKLLLATAAFALLAPAAQAEIKLDLGGYFKGYAGYSDQDTADLRDFDLKRKSEIFFEGETTLDNGLTVGYHGELYQENSSTGDENIEASYLYMSGNWGRVNVGAENGAAYLLQVSAPSADANLDGADIDFSFYNPSAGAAYRQDYAAEGAIASGGGAASTGGIVSLDGGQYADKITYLTPKFNGFQAGISYSPEFDSKQIGDSTAGQQADDDAGNLEDLMEAALRYDGEFEGVGIHVGGGYSTADDEGATADYDQWNAGLKLTFEGFSLGGAYITEETEGAGNFDIDTYVVGAGYDYGAYSFGATYFNSDESNTGDELDRYTIGAGYTFGPGMKFNGSVALYDENDTAGNNDATVVAIGTDIQF